MRTETICLALSWHTHWVVGSLGRAAVGGGSDLAGLKLILFIVDLFVWSTNCFFGFGCHVLVKLIVWIRTHDREKNPSVEQGLKKITQHSNNYNPCDVVIVNRMVLITYYQAHLPSNFIKKLICFTFSLLFIS